jgi:hypothetical protein
MAEELSIPTTASFCTALRGVISTTVEQHRRKGNINIKSTTF